MSTDPCSKQLMEIRTPLNTSTKEKRRKYKTSTVMKALVLVGLIVLVLGLIGALVVDLLRKCEGSKVAMPRILALQNVRRKDNPNWNKKDLPKIADPIGYSLTLQFLDEASSLKEHHLADTFYGLARVNFTMSSDSRFVVLHSSSQLVKKVAVTHIGSNNQYNPIKVVEMLNDEFYEQLILVFDDSLRARRNYSAEIEYSGKIFLRGSGVIRTFYQSINENKRYGILYSQLEPTGARRMYPCFDEPDKKAFFSVKIIHFGKYRALSNMPLQRRETINGSHLISKVFDKTVNSSLTLSVFNTTFVCMSTYLLAFVLVEDYEFISGFTKANTNVSVWAPKGFQESGALSLGYAISTENFLATYLNFSSLMPKADHIYIPSFQHKGRGNWGLMVYSDGRLLISPRTPKIDNMRPYRTIAHAIAHIWFGNWVTMKGWSDLWLTEGFAIYFESLAYYKQLNVSAQQADEFFLAEHRGSLDADGNVESQPVRLGDSNDLKMAYARSKGGAMLVWLNHIMGEQNFRTGIQSYIQRFSEKNPTSEEFFAEMERKAPISLFFSGSFYDFFKPFLHKIGYPVVMVNYDISKKRVIVSQRSVVTNSSLHDTLPIYTTYKTDRMQMDGQFFFRGSHHEINLNVGKQGFLLLNGEGKSYLRVKYSRYLWDRIIENIRSNNSNINDINKIILFDDNLYLAENGMIDLSFTNDLIDTLINETNIIIWSLFHTRVITKVHDLLGDDKVFQKWNNYMLKLSRKMVAKAVEINPDRVLSVYEEYLQGQMFRIGGELNNEDVLRLCSQKFRIWIANPSVSTLPRHLTSTILYFGMKTNDDWNYWIRMWDMMVDKNPQGSIDKLQIAIGLTGTSKPYLLNKLLHYLLTPHTHNSDTDKLNFCNVLIFSILQSNGGINVLSRWIINNHFHIKAHAFGDEVTSMAAQTYLESMLLTIASKTYDLDAIRPLLHLHGNNSRLIRTVMINNNWRENFGKMLIRHLT